MNDHELDADERAALSQLADLLGLQTEQVERIHRQYLESIILAAQRDGRISDAEHNIITRMMASLGIYDVPIPPVTDTAHAINDLHLTSICFTGEAVIDGHTYTRVHMEAVAAFTRDYTQKLQYLENCDLLVAADPASKLRKGEACARFEHPDHWCGRISGDVRYKEPEASQKPDQERSLSKLLSECARLRRGLRVFLIHFVIHNEWCLEKIQKLILVPYDNSEPFSRDSFAPGRRPRYQSIGPAGDGRRGSASLKP